MIIQYIHNTFMAPCEKSKIISFASSGMKKIVVFLAQSKFQVKLVCLIALGSSSRAYCLLKSIAII